MEEKDRVRRPASSAKPEARTNTASRSKKSRRRKKRKKINIFVRVLLVLLAIMAIFAIAIAGLLFGSLYGYVEDTELVDVDNMRLNLTSFVYVTDPATGETTELEQLFDTENRVWVSGSEMPEHLKNAFVAIEDERFYSHSGVDIKRFMGAAMQYLSNKGDSSYGGSTITQQLIKNITSEDDYSIKRKIQEAYRAFNLEKELSKDEILEYYLNTIYLSQKCNGVGSAAQTYFGKEVSELTLAECATLAGITQFPTKYDPLVNPENNKSRQRVILKKMRELGFITEKEYNDALNEEIDFVDAKSAEDVSYQSYFTDAVIDQIIKDMMSEHNYTKEYATTVLYNGGLQIYLSMDPNMQDTLDEVFNDPGTFPSSSKAVQPQSSMVIMDPYTGYVKALCGGRGEKEGNRTLNRATQTLRQPGSTIKPLSVYAPAVEYGIVTPSSIVNDAPVKFGDWSPRNDDRRFAGRIPVSSALRGSRNVPAVKICNAVTAEAAFDFVKNNFHISSLVKEDVRNGKSYTDLGLASIALGGFTDGASVLEMCAAYCAFPNGGKYIKPSLYTKVLDSEGNIFLEHKAEEQIAMSETTAESMVSMLTGVVTGGTGTSARISGMNVAGKTGTTSSKNDRWFVGFTPYYVGAVWFGYDEPAPLNFSGNPAAIAWRKVMTPIHKNLENKSFLEDEKDGKYSIMICSESGMRASPACKSRTSKNYSKSNIPTKLCTTHPYKFNDNDLAAGSAPEASNRNEDVPAVIIDDIPADTPAGTAPNAPAEPSVPIKPASPSTPVPGGNAGIVDGI